MNAMDSQSTQINMEYQFTSDRNGLTDKQRKDVSAILDVSARFKIFINDDLYFDQAEFPILEFYTYLYNWKKAIDQSKRAQEFHYYTLEFDEYEDGAILSIIPFGDSVRLKSIWAEQELYHVFDLDYLIRAFLTLEKDLKRDIEAYFPIKLDKFIKHIPAVVFDWNSGDSN
ncbi:hypothetical protein NST67_16615 [Bacillus sp. FSL W7-1321]